MHAIAVVAEILHIGLRQDVRFREDDGIADAPLQEFAERAEHIVLLARLADVGTLGADDEGHGIHAKAGNAELNPEAHDLEDLGLHCGIGRVEVGLEVVEAVEVPLLRYGLCDQVVFCTPGNTMPVSEPFGRFFDQTYQSRYFEFGSRRAS